MSKRKQNAPEFKAKVALEALEALKSEEAEAEQVGQSGVYSTMNHQWKRALFECAPNVFERDASLSPGAPVPSPSRAPAQPGSR